MKSIATQLILIIILTSNSLCAQHSFTKRKYTKGFFHEKINKLKRHQSNTITVDNRKHVYPQKNNIKQTPQSELINMVIGDSLRTQKNDVIKTIASNDSLIKPVTKSNIKQKNNSKRTPPLLSNSFTPAKTTLSKTHKDNGYSPKKNLVVTKPNYNVGMASNNDEPLLEYLFGDFADGLMIVLYVLAGLTILGALISMSLFFYTHSTLLFVLLCIALTGTGFYFLINNYSNKHNGKGTKILNFLEKAGATSLEILFGIFSAITL